VSQKTLFSEPDPDRLDPAIQYATLEDDEPPFGPLLYLQFLGESLRRERGQVYASIQCRRIWAEYLGEEAT
jgi:hypothetical protein